ANTGEKYVAISAGAGAHTCAIISTGDGRCWGSDSNGQLGDNATTDQSSPVAVQTISKLTSIAAGATHSCATEANGKLFCWGEATDGRLGDGQTAADKKKPDESSPHLTD